jgi:hypothetical protein
MMVDLLARFRERLVALYPGGPGTEVPASIEIGGDAGQDGGSSWGIEKGSGHWRIPEQYRDLAIPLLDREAFLTGFTGKGAAKNMGDICSWCAWRGIEDKAVKKRFFDQWLALSIQQNKRITLYNQPPVLIQEFDKTLDLDPLELHDMLLRFANESERLLGKQLRYDASEQYAFTRAVQLSPVPRPVFMDLLLAHVNIFMETARMPARADVIATALGHRRFSPNATERRLDAEFQSCSNHAYTAFQLNQSLLNNRIIYILHDNPPRSAFLGEVLLNLPGMYVSTFHSSGNMIDPRNPTCISRLILPGAALDGVLDYIGTLQSHHLVNQCKCFVLEDARASVNFNTYIAGKHEQFFTIAPISRDPSLVKTSHVDLHANDEKSSAFIQFIERERKNNIDMIIDKMISPFTFAMARQDSWISSMARTAGVSEKVASNVVDAVTREYSFAIPDPRAFYHVNPQVPAFTRVFFLSRGVVSSLERDALHQVFPAMFSMTCRGAHGADDATMFTAYIPRGELERAVSLVTKMLPGVRTNKIISSMLFKTGYRTLGWLRDGKYDGASRAVDMFTAAVPKLASGEWSAAQFQKNVIVPAKAMFEATVQAKKG